MRSNEHTRINYDSDIIDNNEQCLFSRTYCSNSIIVSHKNVKRNEFLIKFKCKTFQRLTCTCGEKNTVLIFHAVYCFELLLLFQSYRHTERTAYNNSMFILPFLKVIVYYLNPNGIRTYVLHEKTNRFNLYKLTLITVVTVKLYPFLDLRVNRKDKNIIIYFYVNKIIAESLRIFTRQIFKYFGLERLLFRRKKKKKM